MINTVFDENKIDYRVTEVPDSLRVLIHAEEINEYLSCMGADLSFYKSSNGVALTTLYGISTILSENADEYNKPCLENGFIIIGAGPNGDLLCVNCLTGRVGYAFGAELWEQSFSTFSDIYIELVLFSTDSRLMQLNRAVSVPDKLMLEGIRSIFSNCFIALLINI
jgi:hypothetical protein